MSVTLHTTHGPLKLELFCEACPKACENFLALCASGYYDDVPVHRSIKGFMAQTGDGELRTGKGGKSIWPGEAGDGYFGDDEISSALRHNARGTVSMANKGRPNTNGSQFFICYAPQKHLDGVNLVFAKVIDGVDTTLSRIEEVDVDKKHRPKVPVRIQRVTIHANPLAAVDPGE